MHKLLFAGLATLCLVLIVGVFSPVFAEYSIPVSHTHNGREHNHQLPKEGVNHRHGIGQLGKAIRSQNKVIYSNTKTIPNNPKSTYKAPKSDVYNQTGHSHAGREHQHALPNQGVFHRHGTNGAIGQRVANNSNSAVVFDDIQSAPTVNNQGNSNNNSNQNNAVRNQPRANKGNFDKRGNGLNRFVKGATRCPNGSDCNYCAANVQQQFQKAAAKQISWKRKRWNFAWPQAYPPKKVRPLDVFDGDPKYALGIPDKHVQGFVRTNSRLYPYAGSHSHKSKGSIFVIKQGANGEQFLSSLHQTSSKHPSGVQIIGNYLIYGEGSQLVFRDINSRNQNSGFRMTAKGANFGGGLGIIKLSRNNHLLVTTGPGGQRGGKRYNRFYHLRSVKGRPTFLDFINQSSTTKPQQWPKNFSFSENMSLITECGSGDVYAIHTTGDEQGISAIAGKGYWRLSKLVSNGKALGLTAVNAFTTGQDMKRCNVRSAATVSATPQKRLEFVCHGYAKDPDGTGFNILGKASRNRDKFYYNVGIVR